MKEGGWEETANIWGGNHSTDNQIQQKNCNKIVRMTTWKGKES